MCSRPFSHSLAKFFKLLRAVISSYYWDIWRLSFSTRTVRNENISFTIWVLTNLISMNENVFQFAYKEETKRDVDKFRVGYAKLIHNIFLKTCFRCYILFCHIDDKDACVHTKKAGCECREECLDFAWLYSRENVSANLQPYFPPGSFLIFSILIFTATPENGNLHCLEREATLRGWVRRKTFFKHF